jgi:hypothetical protein
MTVKSSTDLIFKNVIFQNILLIKFTRTNNLTMFISSIIQEFYIFLRFFGEYFENINNFNVFLLKVQ